MIRCDKTKTVHFLCWMTASTNCHYNDRSPGLQWSLAWFIMYHCYHGSLGIWRTRPEDLLLLLIRGSEKLNEIEWNWMKLNEIEWNSRISVNLPCNKKLVRPMDLCRVTPVGLPWHAMVTVRSGSPRLSSPRTPRADPHKFASGGGAVCFRSNRESSLDIPSGND